MCIEKGRFVVRMCCISYVEGRCFCGGVGHPNTMGVQHRSRVELCNVILLTGLIKANLGFRLAVFIMLVSIGTIDNFG